jgi:aspartyl-tRNA(Asn)/glutamyl-tRNA(Gln) amidotransferase subunit A
MSDIIRQSAASLAERLAAGELSSVEVTQAHLDRIAAVDPDVHAFLHVAGESALRTAARVDAARAAGERLGPLAGVPVAIKDVLATNDMPSTSGSKILEGWVPPYDATVVRRLREANLIPLGKTNMDEFAMGSSTEHSAYGPTRNPWDLERIPAGPGEDRRPPSPPSKHRSHSAATRAVRSGSRQPSPARSVSSRPTAA